MKKSVIIFLALFGFATGSFAQATASAYIQATLFAPIAITKLVDMNFGSIAVQPGFGGQATLNPDGSRSTTGGLSLPMMGGMVSPASFYVTGSDNFSFNITLPSSDVFLYNGLSSIYANSFTSDPSGTGVLTYGSQTLNVGATLYIAGNEPAGTFCSSMPFDVTVTYY